MFLLFSERTEKLPMNSIKAVVSEPLDGHEEYHMLVNMSCVVRKPTFWFLTWPDTNQAVQSQKMARGLKFRIKKVEGLYYLCRENKGADQLHIYFEADLRLCFRICKMLVFPWW